MEITSHVNRFQAVEQELNVMLKLEDVLVNKVGSITILNLITSMSNMSGLTGNGQQCFEGDCAAGNCTMVVREEESVEVILSVGLIFLNISILAVHFYQQPIFCICSIIR